MTVRKKGEPVEPEVEDETQTETQGETETKFTQPQPFHKVDICPKCGADYLKWEHHPFVILSEACGRAMAQADVAIGSDEWNTYPEHLCVRCNQCGYSWIMGVFADVL